MEPHRASIELLDTVPGVNEIIAWTVIAELGTDMSVFPTTAHVASWAGMCPGTHESAGKQISTRTTKGNRYLRRALLEAAWAATRKKQSYLRVFFQRLQFKKGWGKAIVALGHKLLVILYEIMKTRIPFIELGADYYDQLDPEKTIQRLKARIERLGVEVTIQPKGANA